jgi:hypothetical protein
MGEERMWMAGGRVTESFQLRSWHLLSRPVRMKNLHRGTFRPVGAPQGAMSWWSHRHVTADHPFRGFRRSHKCSFELCGFCNMPKRLIFHVN